jgi:ABC-2 type transport system ATP-binding protein
MVKRPPVLFLDEPTTGLDPTSRLLMWGVIRNLVGDGATLLLTTQYLDEADTLADQIVVIDHGRVIAEGTSQQLKESIGGARLAVTLTVPDPAAVGALAPLVEGAVHVSDDGRRLHAAVRNGSGLGTEAVRALDRAGILVDDVAVLQPSLDDVFFDLTGHPTRPASDPDGSGPDDEAIPA